MDSLDERFLAYTAVLLVCSALAVLVGVAAATSTFALIAIAIEAIYLLGAVMSAPGHSNASY